MGQLDLFQTPGVYENSAFDRAKRLKKIAQNLFNEQTKISWKEDNIHDKYAVIKYDVNVEQIRDGEVIEPSSLRMFIWKFVPTITFTINGVTKSLLESGSSINDAIGPKIIPKWFNDYFTTNSFSHGDFLRYTTQYFTLELIINSLENDGFKKELLELLGGKKLIIYSECKLFPIKNFETSALLEKDIINKISNFYHKLARIQNENWFYIGSYNDFTNENDLLIDLDSNENVAKKKGEVFTDSKNIELFEKTFFNDYLFLNNVEFFAMQKINTDNWENNVILCPKLFNTNFMDIDISKLNINKEINSRDNREIYSYIRKGGGDSYSRNEFLFPLDYLNKEILFEIILIAQKFKK